MRNGWIEYYRRNAWLEQRFFRPPSKLQQLRQQEQSSCIHKDSDDKQTSGAATAYSATTSRRGTVDVDNDNKDTITSAKEPSPSSSPPPRPPPDPQAASPFFSRLPLELRRMIWSALWVSYGGAGTHLHIYTPDNYRLSYSPCVAHDDDDALLDREIKVVLTAQNHGLLEDVHGEKKLWGRRLASDWGRHWRCEEEALKLEWLRDAKGDEDVQREKGKGKEKEKEYVGRSTRDTRSLISVLLACKRMNEEGTATLTETITFIFTEVEVARHFFVVQPPSEPFLSQLQTLHLDIDTVACGLHPSQHSPSSSSLLSSLSTTYLALNPSPSRRGIGNRCYPWEDLTLALTTKLPNLKALRIRLRSPTSIPERLAFARFFTDNRRHHDDDNDEKNKPHAPNWERVLVVEFPVRRIIPKEMRNRPYPGLMVEPPYSFDFWKPPFEVRRSGRRPEYTWNPMYGIIPRLHPIGH